MGMSGQDGWQQQQEKRSESVQISEFRGNPTAILETSISTISPVVSLHGQQKGFQKVDQLTLFSGGSEHAWLLDVAISQSNKMNFSLCANIVHATYLLPFYLHLQHTH